MPDGLIRPSLASGGLTRLAAPTPPRICLITTEFHGLFKNGGIGTANTGLALALAFRILLLTLLVWMIGLTKVVFAVGSFAVSWRDIVLIGPMTE